MTRNWSICCCLAAGIVACQVLSAVAINIQPCRPIDAIARGSQFEVGLVFWPGGLEEQWGNVTNGLQPCNPDVMANLTAQGAMFAAYNVRADRLTMLKTTLPEELILTSKSPSTAPKVISMVAFRNYVRSDVRYIASFDPSITKGTGFVSSLALLAKFELGTLKYLQFYNLTCNDCGGRTSSRCINDTSCALDFSVCTCASSSSSSGSKSASIPVLQKSGGDTAALPQGQQATDPASTATTPANGPNTAAVTEQPADTGTAPPSEQQPAGGAAGQQDPAVNASANQPSSLDPAAVADLAAQQPPAGSTPAEQTSAAPPTRRILQTNSTAPVAGCNYANFTFCATSINLAFEGVDMNSAAFKTGSQIRKLNSFSVLSLYFKAKEAFMNVKNMFSDTAGTYWGNFGAVQADIQQAYSGNAQANVDSLSA